MTFKQTPMTHNQVIEMLEKHRIYIAGDRVNGQKANLQNRFIEDFDFSGLDLCAIVGAQASRLVRCRFVDTDLFGVSFTESFIFQCDFTRAQLGKTQFYSAQIEDTVFDNANLISAEFNGSKIAKVSFMNANLADALIIYCTLSEVIFDGASNDTVVMHDNITI